MKEIIYDIYWEGPFNWEKRNDEKIVKSHHVLYQIYGLHHLYGDKVLLYIGMTSDGIKRLDQHNKWVQDEYDNVEFRIGSLGEFVSWEYWDSESDYPKADDDIVKQVEALLIFAQQTAYNTKNKEDAEIAKGLRIFNSGKSGKLLPEVSYKYFLGD